MSESIKKNLCIYVYGSFAYGNAQSSLSLSLCLVFLFFTLVASSTTASSPKAFVDPMCLSLPSLKPLRHVGLIDVCVCKQCRCEYREKKLKGTDDENTT